VVKTPKVSKRKRNAFRRSSQKRRRNELSEQQRLQQVGKSTGGSCESERGGKHSNLKQKTRKRKSSKLRENGGKKNGVKSYLKPREIPPKDAVI